MARGGNKLTDTAIRSSGLEPGRHSDGGGLYLNVKPSGSKSWLFMWKVAGKRREMGLGSYPEIGLAKARKLAAEHRQAVEEGRDPIAEKKAETASRLRGRIERVLDFAKARGAGGRARTLPVA